MDYEVLVLNKLLDKFEVRTIGSNRRVLIKCDKKEINIPDIESDEYYIFKNDMLSLKSKNYIDFDWVQKDYLIKNIWLIIDNVSEAYRYLEREDKDSKINSVISLIDNAITATEPCWVHDYFEQIRDNIIKSSKLTGIWNSEHKLLNDFLDALINISRLKGKAVSMRAFSVNIYGDSKYFEREIKQYIIPVIKNNEPDLLDTEEISDRAVLAQAGIIMMPEIFEFCGNVKILFDNGIVDFSPIPKGACISSECVSDICSIDIFDTDRILFIENKTNYSEYCLNNKSERELVVYHGGFYSPQRGEFFAKLCSETDIPVYFWGDIDYGGFKMFVRLRNNIIRNVQPFNMDITSYNLHKENGLKKGDDYILKLKKIQKDPDYMIFDDVISEIANEKITVEQESFISNELIVI